MTREDRDGFYVERMTSGLWGVYTSTGRRVKIVYTQDAARRFIDKRSGGRGKKRTSR